MKLREFLNTATGQNFLGSELCNCDTCPVNYPHYHEYAGEPVKVVPIGRGRLKNENPN